MQKIKFTASLENTKITLDNIGATIEQIAHDFPNICS